MKYIDADRLKRSVESIGLIPQKQSDYNDGRNDVIMMVLDLIDSLQQEQPEVDLDEEINRFWDSCIKHKNEKGGNVIWSNKLEIEALVRHFYDRGLNARK